MGCTSVKWGPVLTSRTSRYRRVVCGGHGQFTVVKFDFYVQSLGRDTLLFLCRLLTKIVHFWITRSLTSSRELGEVSVVIEDSTPTTPSLC